MSTQQVPSNSYICDWNELEGQKKMEQMLAGIGESQALLSKCGRKRMSSYGKTSYSYLGIATQSPLGINHHPPPSKPSHTHPHPTPYHQPTLSPPSPSSPHSQQPLHCNNHPQNRHSLPFKSTLLKRKSTVHPASTPGGLASEWRTVGGTVMFAEGDVGGVERRTLSRDGG